MSDTELSLEDVADDPLVLLNAWLQDRHSFFDTLFDDPEHIHLAEKLTVTFEHVFRLMDAEEEKYDRLQHLDLIDKLKDTMPTIGPKWQRTVRSVLFSDDRPQLSRTLNRSGRVHPVWGRLSFGDEEEGYLSVWKQYLEWARTIRRQQSPRRSVTCPKNEPLVYLACCNEQLFA